MSKWKPRASGMGSYLACNYRAAFDRAIHEGLFTLEKEAKAEIAGKKVSSPYAAFGTWAHFYLQDALRCEFDGGREKHLPTDEDKQGAAALHGGDLAATESAVRHVATNAAKHMPLPRDGRPWRAETACSARYLQGHLDFLSQDFLDIVDLKTASRKPPGDRPKPEHIAQVCGAYPALVHEQFGVWPERAHILYVGSDGLWAMLVTIDLQTEERKQYIQQTIDYCNFLRSKTFMGIAMPNLGSHCSDMWCPYTSLCKNKLMPAPSEVFEHGAAFAGMKADGL